MKCSQQQVASPRPRPPSRLFSCCQTTSDRSLCTPFPSHATVIIHASCFARGSTRGRRQVYLCYDLNTANDRHLPPPHTLLSSCSLPCPPATLGGTASLDLLLYLPCLASSPSPALFQRPHQSTGSLVGIFTPFELIIFPFSIFNFQFSIFHSPALAFN